MILSMTGFGRGTAVLNGREITVELRSVNSRYFEYSSRMPRTCSYLDSRLKKQLNERVTRGKLELSLTVQNVEAADTVVTVNMELARSYQQAMRDLSEQLGVKNDISAAVLTRFPDVLTTRHADVDEEQLWEDVSAVTAQALDRFVEMRAAEGAKMKADVENRLNFLEECVGKVETLSAGRVEAYTNRLYEKLKVILEDRDIDDARVLTEAAIFGDKTAVDEETVRLRSHMSQLKTMINGSSPTGRKIDFLIQEFNREANTIGSKCQSSDIAQSQDGRAVRNDCYQIAFVRVTVNLFGVSFDFAARSCDAGRIGQRQVVLRVIGLRRYDRDFPWAAFAVIAQSLLIHFTFSHYPNCFACVCETQREKTCNYCALPSRNGHRTGRS